MRTRKCLILSPLFLIFNNDLSEITNVKESFKNQIEILDLSNCIKLKHIVFDAFSNNLLNEIKILNDITIDYDNDYDYKDDLWNRFVKYYNDNEKKAGDYKLENNEWKWYPL